MKDTNHIIERFTHAFKDLSTDAWNELKTGIDKAWDEIKLGVDDGIHTTSQSFSRAWMELAESIERAKDSLLNEQGPARETPKKQTTNRRAPRNRVEERVDLN